MKYHSRRSAIFHLFSRLFPSLCIILVLGILGGILLTGCGSSGNKDEKTSTKPLLAADPSAPALGALSAIGPVAADAADRSGDLLLTRISVTLTKNATVGQFNAASTAISATGIGYSAPGSPFLTLIVPRQSNGAALAKLANTLRSMPGILFAAPGRQMSAFILPGQASDSPQSPDLLQHLLPSRFPAAWNAAFSENGQQPATRNCTLPEATVFLVDFFETRPADPNNQLAPFAVVQVFGSFNDGPNDHGWQVASVLASTFDELLPTGATALPHCVNFVLVDISGLTYAEIIGKLQETIAAQPVVARLIVNLSFGFGKKFCGLHMDSLCTPENLAITPIDYLQWEIESRILSAIQWANETNDAFDERMLLVQAAGNENAYLPENGGLGILYPGIRQADLASPIALATRLESLETLFSPDSETAAGLWTSELHPPLLLSLLSFQNLKDMIALDVPHVPGMANVVLVGSATNPASGLPGDITESSFSNEYPSVLAVGEQVVGLGGTLLDGTSFAAPQVAGLAAYLWSISDLENRPASETAAHIKLTTTPKFLLDAYAATLALDVMSTMATVGIREALLDVNGDDVFDENDLQRFEEVYGLNDPGTPTIPEARDYSRFDLNGDGATGGINAVPFDLDRGDVVPAHSTLINTVDREIEGYPVTFNEAVISDIQVLCYYAYSTLYAGGSPTPAQEEYRTAVLGPDHCVGVRMNTLFPTEVSGSTSLDVTVEVPAGDGLYAPAANMHVTFSPSCGSVSPTSGRTNEAGSITTIVTPTGCSSSVSVTAVANADEGTTALAQQTVTAAVSGSSSVISRLLIGVGGGKIEAFLSYVGDDAGIPPISSPVSDVAGFVAQLNAELSSVSEVGYFNITFYEPLDLSLSMGIPFGDVHVRASDSPLVGIGCGSSVNLTVGDVRSNNSVTQSDSKGAVTMGGCLSSVTLSVGDVEDLIYVYGSNADVQITAGNVGGAVTIRPPLYSSVALQNLDVNLNAGTAGSLEILSTLNSTFNVHINDVNGFHIQSNSFSISPSISVGNVLAPGGNVVISNNSGLSLSGISMGSTIDGNLTITNNAGFSDAAANSFADSKTIAGTTSISGNLP